MPRKRDPDKPVKARGPQRVRSYPRTRQYQQVDKATALALLDENLGNVARTAKQLAISETTLRKWRDGKSVDGVIVVEKKQELSELFERIARLYIRRAEAPAAVAATSGPQAVTAAAIATDKMRLLRNEPTSITGKEQLTDAQLLERLQRLAAAIQSRRSGPVEPNGTGGVRGADGAGHVPHPTVDSVSGTADAGPALPG
jgi:transposase-like protein